MSITEHNDVSKDKAPARRLEIFTGAGRRRAWTAGEKAVIVAETYEDGARTSDVARRHGLTPQQLFGWRRAAQGRVQPRAGQRSPLDDEDVGQSAVARRLDEIPAQLSCHAALGPATATLAAG